MQQMLVSQLPLSQRIPALADAIRSLRSTRAQLDREEAECLAQLTQAEQELKAHPAGSEDTEPSGLLTERPQEPEPAPSDPEPAPKKARR